MSLLNGNLIKVYVGGAISASIGLASFMGYGIVNNDIRNTTQHREIRKEMIISDKEIDKSIEKVSDIVIDIRMEQVEQREILKGIASKL